MKINSYLRILVIILIVTSAFQDKKHAEIPTTCIDLNDNSFVSQSTQTIKTIDSTNDFWKIDEEF